MVLYRILVAPLLFSEPLFFLSTLSTDNSSEPNGYLFFSHSMLRMQHSQIKGAEALHSPAILGDSEHNTKMYHDNGPSNKKQTSQCRPESWNAF